MNILAIETSSPQGSIALQIDDHIEQIFLGEQRQQIAQILPSIDLLLNKNGLTVVNLDLLSFSAGPGSFTGVRVALGVVQGLALATGLPVIPISSLQTLAQTALRTRCFKEVLCCVNAYMHEIYVAAYKMDTMNLMTAESPEQLLSPTAVQTLSFPRYHGVGDAWEVYFPQLTQLNDVIIDRNKLFPQAHDVISLAERAFQREETISIEDVAPRYLRDKRAWQKTR